MFTWGLPRRRGSGMDGLAGQAGGLGTGVFICKAGDGQPQEDGERRWGMEYPPWGLASCWGGKLLRAKVPPPDTRVWGWGQGTERRPPPRASGFPGLRQAPGGAPPLRCWVGASTLKWGLGEDPVHGQLEAPGAWQPRSKVGSH